LHRDLPGLQCNLDLPWRFDRFENMNMIVGYRRFQTLRPSNLLLDLMRRQVSGCLQIASGFVYWSIYLEQGKLVFATNSVTPFERLERHLSQVNAQLPTPPVWRQLNLLYSRKPFHPNGTANSDYQAIAQLVQHQYLAPTQATQIIERIAQEVLASFLTVQDASYELIERDQFEIYPSLCQLEVRSLLEQARFRAKSLSPTLTSVEEPLIVQQPPNVEPKVELVEMTHTIACIDDSPSILQVIQSFLDNPNLTVLLISDPLKALLQIARTKPDLILLDVGMPNLDGYELCALLRRHPILKQTPVVMVTGHTGFIDRAKAKIAGASGYLTKPFTKDELQTIVTKHLSQQSEKFG
jgi:two-component system, chemotaxis family, response regulator PixG